MQPDAGAVLDGIEVGGGGDRADPGNGESPADVIVRLPIDDLFERRQPSGHALRGGADAAAPARRLLLDDDRPLPCRSQGR